MRRSPKQAGGPFEEMFLYAFPNPNRVGCPGRDVLRGLATKELPISHPARLHIMKCSPCFQEFRALEKEIHQAKVKVWTQRGLALAASILVLVGAILFFTHHHESQQTIAVWTVPSSVRGLNDTSTKAFTVPQRTGQIQMTLPFGSDDGQYEVEIRRRPEGSAIQTYSGHATIVNGETKLNFVGSFKNLDPGSYTVAYRHADASWHTLPLIVQ